MVGRPIHQLVHWDGIGSIFCGQLDQDPIETALRKLWVASASNLNCPALATTSNKESGPSESVSFSSASLPKHCWQGCPLLVTPVFHAFELGKDLSRPNSPFNLPNRAQSMSKSPSQSINPPFKTHPYDILGYIQLIPIIWPHILTVCAYYGIINYM